MSTATINQAWRETSAQSEADEYADEQEPLTDEERDDQDDAAQAEIHREWDALYALTARLDSERALHEELTAA